VESVIAGSCLPARVVGRQGRHPIRKERADLPVEVSTAEPMPFRHIPGAARSDAEDLSEG
jgi:hypothetical protein